MADNTTINIGSGGDVVRDKDRSGIKTQILALDLNPAGSESLMAGIMPIAQQPDATSTYAPTNATSTAFEASRVIKASAGVLYSLTIYSKKTSSQYIQIFNSATVPADTTAPTLPPLLLPATSSMSLSFGGVFGRYFSTGISISNSSTDSTKTIGSADCWFDAQYS